VTYDRFFTELIIKYHKGEVTRDDAMITARNARSTKMTPCAYVPWRDVSIPLTCDENDMLKAGAYTRPLLSST
jgi:hypothetical protein